jgi:hypothetical protein
MRLEDAGISLDVLAGFRAPNKTSLSAASSPPRTAAGAVLPAPALQAQVLGVFSLGMGESHPVS